MKSHIYKKNSKRYRYYSCHSKYMTDIKSVSIRTKISYYKNRYLNYNKYFYYTNPETCNILSKQNDTNTTTIKSLDLSSDNIFINGLSREINNSTTQTDTIKTNSTVALFDCSNKSNKDSNRFNVLDLLLPGLTNNRLQNTINTPKSIIPKSILLEHTDEEKLYEFEILDFKIETIKDLITLGKNYKTIYLKKKKRYNLNLRVLSEMIEPLEQLDNLVGMDNIKEAIFEKIILFLQGLDNSNKDFQHIVLYGGPGMGKTLVAKIIGKIYASMGILSKGDFKEAKLTDLKGAYVGQSEMKTQKLLEDAKGCVLFLDEAYSLGSEEKIDTYSQSIIDLINPFLDSNKNDFILIIAGYKADLESRFFRGNQGLKSRFGLWLEITPYTSLDLKNIFIKKIKDYNWYIKNDEIQDDFFQTHKDHFKFYGRDIENFFSKCKIAHAKRVLYCSPESKKKIILDDIIKGFEIFKAQTYNNSEKEYATKVLLESLYS